MARASSLPERLRYLQPFRKKCAALPPEELHEDSGTDPLFSLYFKRIKGLPPVEAEKLLEEDIAVLRDWLSKPTQQNDPLHFAIGVFCIYSPAELVKHLFEQAKKTPEPTLCFHMVLPPGAKLRRVAGGGEEGVLFSWQGLLAAFSAIPEAAVAGTDRALADRSRIEKVISTVSFGEVIGKKYVGTGESWRGPFKQVDYLLVVPGGHVCVRVSAGMKVRDELNWDESKLERYFHTLHVTLKQPPGCDS